jgi:FkbM family methyltransferase
LANWPISAKIEQVPEVVAGGSEEFAAHETRVFTLLAGAGFAPATIYDIGASNGTWSALISNVFPDAAFHMFEPLAEVNESFSKILRLYMGNNPKFALHDVALGADCKQVTMRIHPDGFSSTTLDVVAHPERYTSLSVPQYTLDQYVVDHNLPRPDLIKLDTQGAEIAILNHGELCLNQAALVLAETWLDRTEYGLQTPLITDLTDLLERHEFVLAELGCRFYNERHQFYCCDAFFLKRAFLDTVAPAMPPGPWA